MANEQPEPETPAVTPDPTPTAPASESQDAAASSSAPEASAEPAGPSQTAPAEVTNPPLQGHFVTVTGDGEHAGRIGVWLDTDENGDALLRARDHNGPVDLFTVAVTDLASADPYKGGR